MTKEEIQILISEITIENNKNNFEKGISIAKKVLFEVRLLIQNSTEFDCELYKFEAFSLIRIASNKNLQMKTAESMLICEEAEAIIEKYNIEELKVQLYNTKGNNASNLRNNSEALEYFQMALKYYTNDNNLNGKALIFLNIGNVYLNIGQYREAEEYMLQSIAIQEELGNFNALSLVYGSIAIVYRRLSEFHLSLEYNYKALSLHIEFGNKESEARILGNIGNIYLQISNYEEAIRLYQEALSIEEMIGNQHGIARTIGNIGNVFFCLDQLDSALEYYNKSLLLETELSNQTNISNMLSNISDIQSQQKNYLRSNEILYQALNLYEKNEDLNMYAVTKYKIGKNYIELKDFSNGFLY